MFPGDQPTCRDAPVISMLNGTVEFEEMTYRIFNENKVKGDKLGKSN